MVLKSAQTGNAVVYILIAVALFGALSYSFMRGSQSSQGNLTKHQARLAAIEMIEQANNIERGVQKLLRNGCSEGELNFNSPAFPSPTAILNHPYARPDGSCDIYGTAGGITPLLYPKSAGYYEDQPSGFRYRGLYVPRLTYILDIGTNYRGGQPQNIKSKSADLAIVAQFTNRQICEQISKITGFSDTVLDMSSLYENTLSTECDYAALNNLTCVLSAYHPAFSGKTAGCFYQPKGAKTNMAFPRYIFYRVLIAR